MNVWHNVISLKFNNIIASILLAPILELAKKKMKTYQHCLKWWISQMEWLVFEHSLSSKHFNKAHQDGMTQCEDTWHIHFKTVSIYPGKIVNGKGLEDTTEEVGRTRSLRWQEIPPVRMWVATFAF